MYALGKRIRSKCKFSDFRLLAWKLTKFLMSFFKPQVSFPLHFAKPFSVMTHNSLKFSNWNIICFAQEAHQCTIFLTFRCSNECSPNKHLLQFFYPHCVGEKSVWSSFFHLRIWQCTSKLWHSVADFLEGNFSSGFTWFYDE